MTWARIGDLVSVAGGGTPRRSEARYYDGDIPWVTPKDMKRHRVGTSEVAISEDGVQNSPAKLIDAGSTLVVVRSGVLKHTLPVAVTTRAVTVNQDMKALTPRRGQVDPNYLARLVKAQEPLVLRCVRATTADNFPIDDLLSIEIPLPSLTEQRRIASILDEADALRQQAKRRPRLVHSFEDAYFLETFGDPRSVASRPLLQVVRAQSGGTPSKARADYWAGTIPWVSPKDMKARSLFDAIDHVSETAVKETSMRLIPPDTVVIVVRGMILVHTFPVARLRVPSTINQDMKALIPRESIDPAFLASAIRVQSASVLGAVSVAGHGTRRLDAEVVNAIRVPVTTREQQSEYGAAVAEAERLGESADVSQGELNSLFASLQRRAFRGEL